jgi:peptide/nickel transport system permease protein
MDQSIGNNRISREIGRRWSGSILAPKSDRTGKLVVPEVRNLRQLAWQRFRRHRPALVGLSILFVEIAFAVLAPVFISEDLALRPEPTIMLQTPSPGHLLGTDEAGRDILARLVYAGRISLTIGFLAVTVAVTLGTTLGATAGYYGGTIDNLIMRVTDAMLSIPILFILIVLAVFFGPSMRTLILVIGILSWMDLARIIRANFLSLKEKEFVESARAIGVTDLAIMVRHILPNTLAPIVVAGTLGVGNAMLAEAAVSYLGLGVQPPTPSWGNMLFNAQSYLWNAPWVALFPGLMILITVLAVNFIGDGLRDALDPRMIL